jgi:hypothetical protein
VESCIVSTTTAQLVRGVVSSIGPREAGSHEKGKREGWMGEGAPAGGNGGMSFFAPIPPLCGHATGFFLAMGNSGFWMGVLQIWIFECVLVAFFEVGRLVAKDF